MKYLIATVALLAASTNAFVPTASRQSVRTADKTSTSLGPGFLKDLGFEKPSWLPDFGKEKKKEAKEAIAVADASEEEGEGEETTSEEAPADNVAP